MFNMKTYFVKYNVIFDILEFDLKETNKNNGHYFCSTDIFINPRDNIWYHDSHVAIIIVCNITKHLGVLLNPFK